jgi:hypothetical protein
MTVDDPYHLARDQGKGKPREPPLSNFPSPYQSFHYPFTFPPHRPGSGPVLHDRPEFRFRMHD